MDSPYKLLNSFNNLSLNPNPRPGLTGSTETLASTVDDNIEDSLLEQQRQQQQQDNWRETESTLRRKWDHVLLHGKFCDVECTVGQDRVKIFCHSLVLKLHSQTFAEKHGDVWPTEREPMPLVMEWIEPEPLQYFLRYLYIEHVDFGVEHAVSVLKAARVFDIQPLVKICNERIKSGLRVQNAAFIYQKSHGYDDEVNEALAKKYILQNAGAVFKTAGFLELTTDSVGVLLESPQRQIHEVEAFHAIYRWACAEHKRKQYGGGDSLDGNMPQPELTDEYLLSISDDLRDILRPVIGHIKFSLFKHQEFSRFVASRGVLEEREALKILTQLSMAEDVNEPTATATGIRGAGPVAVTRKRQPHSLNISALPADAAHEYTLLRYTSMTDDQNTCLHPQGHEETDKISFKVDKRISITGIGLYGFNNGKAEPVVVDVRLVLHEDQKVQLGVFVEEMELPSASGVVRTEFPTAVEIEPDTQYTIKVLIHGPVRPFGTGGRTNYRINIRDSEPVSWEFMNAKGQRGYRLSRGQIPEIYFTV